MSKSHEEITEWLERNPIIKKDVGMMIYFGWTGLRGGAKPSKIREPYKYGRLISAKVIR